MVKQVDFQHDVLRMLLAVDITIERRNQILRRKIKYLRGKHIGRRGTLVDHLQDCIHVLDTLRRRFPRDDVGRKLGIQLAQEHIKFIVAEFPIVVQDRRHPEVRVKGFHQDQEILDGNSITTIIRVENFLVVFEILVDVFEGIRPTLQKRRLKFIFLGRTVIDPPGIDTVIKLFQQVIQLPLLHQNHADLRKEVVEILREV